MNKEFKRILEFKNNVLTLKFKKGKTAEEILKDCETARTIKKNTRQLNDGDKNRNKNVVERPEPSADYNITKCLRGLK